jgi:hypothetical protein
MQKRNGKGSFLACTGEEKKKSAKIQTEPNLDRAACLLRKWSV